MDIPINILTDVEMDKITNALNNTITSYGTIKLKSLLTKYIPSYNELIEKKKIFKKMKKNKEIISKIEEKLNELKQYEDEIYKWFGSSFDESLYFKKQLFNKSSILLTVSNKMQYYSVLIIVLIHSLVYIILKIIGFDIGVVDYFKTLYKQYTTIISIILSIVIKNKEVNSALAKLLVILYGLQQLYMIYNYINLGYLHYKKCSITLIDYNRILEAINIIEQIKELDFMLKTDVPLVLIKSKFQKNLTLGNILILRNNKNEYEHDFTNILEYIGLIDVYIMSFRLLETKMYSLPKYIKSKKIILKINKLWNPLLEYTQTKNDFDFKHNLTLVTGPNKSGKTTYIKTVLLCVILSQSLGICPCKNIILTPFDNIFSQIILENMIGHESLFEYEINNIFNLLNIIKNKKQKTFFVMDELMTGTNTKEGIANSLAICQFLSKKTNVIGLITTHFTQICTIDIINYIKFMAKKKHDKYIFKYKLYTGISDQFIATELLKEKGYEHEIINNALENMKNN